MQAGDRGIGHGPAAEGVGLAAKTAFLASGAPWPGQPPPVCIDTHASRVFLTADRAWKLKKPVKLVHVDQRTPEARLHLCREELRLNRELAGAIYRGLTPLVILPDGALALGGQGVVVDWLIEIDRLPATRMLDRLLRDGPAPRPPEIAALCGVLIDFYRRRPGQREGGGVFYRRLVRDCQIADAHLRAMAPKAGVALPDTVLAAAAGVLDGARAEIVERGRRRLIVEGHGDLRAEHVCLTDPPVVFDRLEIDHGLRAIDPFYEVNALGLECAGLGAPWIHAALLEELSGAIAPPSAALLRAYGVAANLTRARIAADHFRDRTVAEPQKQRSKAERHLAAAVRLLAQP